MSKLTATLVSRVLDRCVLDTDTGCLVHTGSDCGNGYAQLKVNNKNQLVHRVIYSAVNNVTLEKGDVIRHTCDNRRCCNPNHLLIGTHRDNMNDRRKRNPDFGSNEDRGNVFTDWLNGMTFEQLATKHNRGYSTMWRWVYEKLQKCTNE